MIEVFDCRATMMLVTRICWIWWWQIKDVGVRINMSATFCLMYQIGHQHHKSVTNISNIRHQHRRSLIFSSIESQILNSSSKDEWILNSNFILTARLKIFLKSKIMSLIWLLWNVELTDIIYNALLGVKICKSDIGNAIVLWEWDQ